MIFHENFCERPLDICDTPQWFALRGDLYKDVSNWKNKPFDQVFFEFSKPDCGWIDVTTYVSTKYFLFLKRLMGLGILIGLLMTKT